MSSHKRLKRHGGCPPMWKSKQLQHHRCPAPLPTSPQKSKNIRAEINHVPPKLLQNIRTDWRSDSSERWIRNESNLHFFLVHMFKWIPVNKGNGIRMDVRIQGGIKALVYKWRVGLYDQVQKIQVNLPLRHESVPRNVEERRMSN